MLKCCINFRRYFIVGFALFLFLFELPLATARPENLDVEDVFLSEENNVSLRCLTPSCPEVVAAPGGTTGPPNRTTIEALLTRISISPEQTQFLLDIRFVGLSVETLQFQLLVHGGEEKNRSIREELFRYLHKTWEDDSITIEIIEDIRTVFELSSKEKARLYTKPFWPGYYDGRRRELAQSPDIPCPPDKTDDIRAIEKALEKCDPNGTPKVRCDCNEGTQACAFFRGGPPPEIFLCPGNCEGTVRRLQSSWIHELIHALQYACNKTDWDSLDCNTTIRLEYLAYLCQGKCSSIIDCCWAQAHSSSDRCYSYAIAVRMCFEELYRRASDWVDHAFMCCPNQGAPDSYSECNDSRNIEGEPQPDGICDTYQNCFPLAGGGIGDADSDGICDNFEEGYECRDSNGNGIGDCWEPTSPGGVVIESPLLSCSELESMSGSCPEASQSPSDRRIECINENGTQVIAYVCCRDENQCSPGQSPCWLPPDECSVPQWCF